MVSSVDQNEGSSSSGSRAVGCLKNLSRSALNNVTNTGLLMDSNGNGIGNGNNNVIGEMKMINGKREVSKIPQLKKATFPEAASNMRLVANKISNSNNNNNSNSNHIGGSDGSDGSGTIGGGNSTGVDENDKENQDPQQTMTGFEVSSQDTTSQQQLSSQLQSQQAISVIEETQIEKKRPISTVVEQDSPKKFKICNEIGEGEDYEWEDLDAEDVNDPFMVSEYVNDIFDYLHHLEVVTLPQKDQLFKHRNINQNRDILVNWLIKIHNKFGLLPETLYLAINLMDRFLCKELVQLEKLQLVGTSCLFIASKYEEVYSPSIKHFASETDGACTENEIKEGEKFILKTLKFNLNYPNPMNFLRRISKADDYDIQSRTLAKFLLEISLVDFRFIGILPSLCAAAAMFLSRKMLGKGKWDGNLIHYSGNYVKKQLAPVCQMMMDYLVGPIVHDEFHRKYQSRRFMKASIISVQWALKVRKNNYDIMTLHE